MTFMDLTKSKAVLASKRRVELFQDRTRGSGSHHLGDGHSKFTTPDTADERIANERLLGAGNIEHAEKESSDLIDERPALNAILRTYLFTNTPYYSPLSLPLLSRTFNLEVRVVTSIISQKIWNEELSASSDQSAGVAVLPRVGLMGTQRLVQVLAAEGLSDGQCGDMVII
jgi:hypothetical protein